MSSGIRLLGEIQIAPSLKIELPTCGSTLRTTDENDVITEQVFHDKYGHTEMIISILIWKLHII